MQLSVHDVEFVKELYCRIRDDDAAIERYRDAIEKLPPIIVARGRILVDGHHRLQAFRREGITTVEVEDLGNLSDAEILRESIVRNVAHGHQLSRDDKKRLTGQLWLKTFADLPDVERKAQIVALLSVSEKSVDRWTEEARSVEKKEKQAKTWDLWLDCNSLRDIERVIGVDHATLARWMTVSTETIVQDETPPASVQHFDIWEFRKADNSAGMESYFGRMPPQVVENLLWAYTKPGQIVFDPFVGGGTTIDVAKKMGRRVWGSDLNPSTPILPIHEHDITAGWPKDAPPNVDFILLDPPYWKQAKGRYDDNPNDLGNQDLEQFMTSWCKVVETCRQHLTQDGYLAFIISPTETDDGVVDHALRMWRICTDFGLRDVRRFIVPYQTQQATGQQVEWAKKGRKFLKQYRDLIVFQCVLSSTGNKCQKRA
jgi:hypothetical protein